MQLTALLPDVLDPAAHYVPSGLSQSLTGTNTGPLFPAGREGGREGDDGERRDEMK